MQVRFSPTLFPKPHPPSLLSSLSGSPCSLFSRPVDILQVGNPPEGRVTATLLSSDFNKYLKTVHLLLMALSSLVHSSPGYCFSGRRRAGRALIARCSAASDVKVQITTETILRTLKQAARKAGSVPQREVLNAIVALEKERRKVGGVQAGQTEPHSAHAWIWPDGARS